MLFLPTALENEHLMPTLVGRTVIAARFVNVPNPGWETATTEAYLTFDDGRTIEFRPFGHDSWGVDVLDVTDET